MLFKVSMHQFTDIFMELREFITDSNKEKIPFTVPLIELTDLFK